VFFRLVKGVVHLRILVMLGWASGYGGVENVVRMFVQSMTNKGHDVVITLDSTGIQNTEWLNGTQWDSADLGMEKTGEWWKFKRLSACIKVLRRVRPDIVLIDIPYWIPYFRLARRLLSGSVKRPVLASWIHTHIDSANRPLMKWLSAADCHMVLSAVHADTLATTTSEENIRIVHNPVVIPGKMIDRSSVSTPHLVFVGRLAAEKRVDLILMAMAELADTGWTASIIGDGPLKDELHKLERDLFIAQGRVSWLGWRKEPWEEVSDATVLVLPSPREGFPLVVVEALARGIPVIVSDGQLALKKFVREGGGWTFANSDTNDLTRVLRRIAEGAESLPNQAHLLKLAEPYGVDEWGNHFETSIRELVNEMTVGARDTVEPRSERGEHA